MSDFLLFSQTNSIATITLNRPELHNAFNDDIILQLTQLLKKVEADTNIRAVILNANGKSFCAGADLNWMRKIASYSHAENRKDAASLAELMQTLYALNKPTIAMVQGAAFGGGVGLIACCDIAIASSEANFCFSEVKLGIIPAIISPYVLAAIGERHAKRYFLTAEKFNAQEAARIGLIHTVVNPDELTSASTKITNALFENSPAAVYAAKNLIHQISKQLIDQTVIQKTIECIADIRVSPEGQEGLNAFLEKRPPIWNK